MSKNMLKLSEIYQSIEEAFDFESVIPTKFNEMNNFEYVSEDESATLNFSDTEVDGNHEIANLPDSLKNAKTIYNVAFSVEGRDDQAYKTDYKEYISILKGIKICIEKFISKFKPDILLFVSFDKGGEFKNDPTKDKLYKYALLKNLPNGYNADFDVKIFLGLNIKGIMLYKKSIREIRIKNRNV